MLAEKKLDNQLFNNQKNPKLLRALFYITLNNLNNDPFIYQDGNGLKKGRAGYFYLCWIDAQKCLHHFRSGKYQHPYSSNQINNLLRIVDKHPHRNWFLSPNTYRSKKVRDASFSNGKSNVRTITSFYLDFDVKNAGLNMAEFRDKLPIILDRCHIVPNAIINSGHGYHVYIILSHGNPVNSTKIFKHWQRVQQDMIRAVGNECKKIFNKSVIDSSVSDINRILRVAGSYNMKNPLKPLPVKVEYLDTTTRPSFKDIIYQWHDWYLSQRDFKRIKHQLRRKQHKLRKNIGHSTRTLNFNRCRDLFTEAGLKKAHGVATGYRDLILFYYETVAIRPNHAGKPIYSDAETISNVKALNQSFKEPLSDHQVASITDEIPKIHAMIRLEQRKRKAHVNFKTRYCPSNQTMIKDIQISNSDQRHLLTIIGSDEVKRRKPINYKRKLASRKRKRKQRRAKRNRRMIKMASAGYSNKEIASKYHKSIRTVERAVKSANITRRHNTCPLDIQLSNRASKPSCNSVDYVSKRRLLNNINNVNHHDLLKYLNRITDAPS